jgi:hypothetical protein
MKLLIAIAFWFASAGVFGQLTAKWNTDHCRIGEQVVLKLCLRQAGADVRYTPYSAVIPCEMRLDSSALTQDGSLEIIGSFKDTTYRRNGARTWEGTYTVTAWDTGVYVLPRILVDPGKGDTIYQVQPKPLTVSFEKKKIDDSLEEVPVVVENDSWIAKYWLAVLVPLVIVIIGVIIILSVVRKKNRAPQRQLSLKDRTRLQLGDLRKKALWKDNRLNEHYIEFSFLLRSFLSERYELNLMERTTFETILLLRTREIPEPTLERIRRLLQESDIVKFGMGVPDEESILLSLNYFEELIIELTPLELIE